MKSMRVTGNSARRSSASSDLVTFVALCITAAILFVVFAARIALAEPSPATGEVLPFDAALSRIVERSTAVAEQRSRLGSQVAGALPSRLFLLPKVEVSAKRALWGSEYDPDAFGNAATLNANVNVFRFGGDIAAWATASSGERAERALLTNALLAAEQDAVDSLISYVAALREVEVSKKSLALQDELIRIGRARYDRGMLPMQEVDKLAIDLENIRSSVADAEIRLAEASARLDSLLGGPRVSGDWPWKSRFLKSDLASKAGNLEERPDLQAAEARLDAESHLYQERVASALPSVDLSYSYGYTSGVLAAARDDGRSWSGALTLSIPLFDRLTNISAARAQAYQREGAEARLEQARRNARRDLDGARASFTVSRQSVLAREKALEYSGKVYGDSLKRFQAGRLDANALTVDQSRLLSAELNAVRGWATLHTTASRLCHAQGFRLADCLKAD